MAGELIKVYSHPRSGTHFLETILAKNFYEGADLSINEVVWGHWSNRQKKLEPNPYGKLFGSHIFPSAIKHMDNPAVYIYRDPRAVAYSIWKTPNFINPEIKNIPFSEFIRVKLDWIGSPAYKCRQKYNIFQHWERHVSGWFNIAKKNKSVMIIQYEELKNDPDKILSAISSNFNIPRSENLITVNEPVGLLPNKAQTDSWKEIFTDEDIIYTEKRIKSKYLKSIYF